MKKIIVSIICVLVLSTSIPINAVDTAQEDGLLETIVIENQSSMDYDRWAVIVGTEYGEYPIPGVCAWEATAFYNNLTSIDENWKQANIKLLTDENATKQDILDALDWLKDKAGEGDIVLFSFFGHGSFVDDKPPYDELDGKDELIVSYDCYRDQFDTLHNIITDDELSDIFDTITEKGIEGMYLIFSCCVSGGLIDWTETTRVSTTQGQSFTTLNQPLQELNNDLTTKSTSSSEHLSTNEETIELADGSIKGVNSCATGSETNIEGEIFNWLGLTEEELITLINNLIDEINTFTTGLSDDIAVDGRVVLTSSIPHAAGFAPIPHEDYVISLSQGIFEAIEEGKTTAEDISFYAKWWYLSHPEVFLIGVMYYMLKDSGLQIGSIPLSLLVALIIQLTFLLERGLIILPIPLWKDGYPSVNNPLSAKLQIIGEIDGSNNQNIQSQPSTPQSNPSSQQTTPRSSPTGNPTNN